MKSNFAFVVLAVALVGYEAKSSCCPDLYIVDAQYGGTSLLRSADQISRSEVESIILDAIRSSWSGGGGRRLTTPIDDTCVLARGGLTDWTVYSESAGYWESQGPIQEEYFTRFFYDFMNTDTYWNINGSYGTVPTTQRVVALDVGDNSPSFIAGWETLTTNPSAPCGDGTLSKSDFESILATDEAKVLRANPSVYNIWVTWYDSIKSNVCNAGGCTFVIVEGSGDLKQDVYNGMKQLNSVYDTCQPCDVPTTTTTTKPPATPPSPIQSPAVTPAPTTTRPSTTSSSSAFNIAASLHSVVAVLMLQFL